MPGIRLPAFAKINLQLHILGPRPDGYHELRTIYQAVSLADELELEATRTPGIRLELTGNEALAREPAQNNLVYRALQAVRSELGLRGGVRARLLKRIPVGRGLGGGSSDAAAVLAGTLRMAGRRMPLPRLLEIAASLGADVPFFLFGGTALGVGRGDEVYPLPDVPRRAVLIVSPRDIAVPTADAYRWVREDGSPVEQATSGREQLATAELTKALSVPRLSSFCALCWNAQLGAVWNDFERTIFLRHPRLGEIKRELLQSGAAEAALAGSGSAVFAFYRSPAQARRAAQRFPQDQVLICATVSRGEYSRAQRGGVGTRSRGRR
jgi:4-diphosphocytidyl-2-C-methyl-D-erythritol kinase